MNSTSPKNVLILGGYGSAGQAIAKLLSEQMHTCITIAGRSFDKAQACVHTLQKKQPPTTSFVPLAINANQQDQLTSSLAQQDLIIVCVNIDKKIAKNLVQAVLHSNADYIDIVPGNAKYLVFKQHETEIRNQNRRFILDAGADPGLPGWLARYAVSQLKNATEVALYAKYRDKYIGYAGIQDLLEHSLLESREFTYGKWRNSPFWRMKMVLFPGGFGRALSIPVFLEELRSVPQSTGIKKLTLYHAGSNLVTDIILMFWKIGIHRFMPAPTIGKLLQKALEKFTLEPTGGVLMAQAKTDVEQFWIKGWHYDLYQATAIPAVLVATQVLSSPLTKPGCWFLGEWVDSAPFMDSLQKMGFCFEIYRERIHTQ